MSRPILPVDLPQERYQRKIQGPYPNGVVPDFSRPILFYSGEISEPTKFSIKKGIDESIKKKISSELYKLLIESVYEIRDDFDCKCVDLNRNGQRLYTYNPEREVVLYLRMGFKVMADKPIVERNGIRWVPIEATPDVLLNYANGKTTSEDKKRFFESLETSFSDDLSFIDR